MMKKLHQLIIIMKIKVELYAIVKTQQTEIQELKELISNISN